MSRTMTIDVVDEDGCMLLSIEPHFLPSNVSAEDVVKSMLPMLSEIYKYRCYYTRVEIGEETCH